MEMKRSLFMPTQTPNLFRNGFLNYLESGDFSDVTLIVGEKEYRVHKLILAYSSQFFAHAFLSDFRESQENRVEIKLPDPRNRIPLVLQYMYEGVIDITVENQMDLLAISDHFLMNELKTVVMERILKHTGKNNALPLLLEATKIKAEPIIAECLAVITKYFSQSFAEQELVCMKHEHFLRVMQNPSLQVNSEAQVYNVITDYIRDHPELSPKQIAALYGCVRYRWLSHKDLQEVSQNQRVPRQYLVEALMEKLKASGRIAVDFEAIRPAVGSAVDWYVQENADKSERDALPGVMQQMLLPADPATGQIVNNRPRGTNLRLQRRPEYAIHFEYRADFDECGIIHFISTDGATGEWANPAQEPDHKLKITASSIEKGAPHNIVAKEPTECWTMDVPASWFAIGFEDRACRCTAYTLRHGGNYRADSLRNWDIQGSNDGEHWTLLKRHTNDLSLGSNYATATWKIPIEKQAHKFRIFRILQTGHNSSNHNFLVLSGIELYGHLYEKPRAEKKSSTPVRTAGPE